MREIPKLQVLCLRAVGSHDCSTEDTFAHNPQTGEPSKSSLLLRAFHQRGKASKDQEDDKVLDHGVKLLSIKDIPLQRTVCVGKNASRRANANDVDLNHPLIAYKEAEGLVMEHGSPALDCLQSYIDSLVELGRMDDARLGVCFFEEWKANVLVAAGKDVPWKKIEKEEEDAFGERPRKRSRRSSGNDSTTLKLSIRVTLPKSVQGPPPPLGSLSLQNCAIAEETIEAMRDSGMGLHLGVLDLGGIYGLNDALLEQFLPQCPNLTRLSLKNCRRITVISLKVLAQYQTKLKCLDIGGTYNVTPDEVLETLVVGTTNKPAPELVELHASGLGWNDRMVGSLVGDDYDDDDDSEEEEEKEPRHWKALSLGFSHSLSALGLRHSLSKVSTTLISLALHFCETVVDNALMGMLGRNLPHVKYLDVRGNASLSSMTGWYDGRASADLDTMQDDEEEVSTAQELVVLARFTGITKNSLEETLRVFPMEAANLTCILDGGGAGVGVYR